MLLYMCVKKCVYTFRRIIAWIEIKRLYFTYCNNIWHCGSYSILEIVL